MEPFASDLVGVASTRSDFLNQRASAFATLVLLRRWVPHRAEDFIARPIYRDKTLFQDQNLVSLRERGWPVADDNQCGASFLETEYCLGKSGFSRLIEIGIGLVKNNQLRVTKDARANPTRWRCPPDKPDAPIADLGVVALRKVLDHFMGVREHCRSQILSSVTFIVMRRNVVAHRSGK